jgi:hypothetical protein
VEVRRLESASDGRSGAVVPFRLVFSGEGNEHLEMSAVSIDCRIRP